MRRRLAASLLIICQPASAAAQEIDESSTSWDCGLFFNLASGTTTLSGRYRRSFDFHGHQSYGIYDLWGDVHVEWAITGQLSAPRKRINYITVNVPTTRHSAGIYGYLFGDSDLISVDTLLDPADFQRGHSSRFEASFRGGKVEKELDKYDRWTFVMQNGDGEEIVRKTLNIPDRKFRDYALRLHTAALEAAWTARDTKLLETVHADTLRADQAYCLLSTAETREIIEASTYDPMPTRRR